MKELMQQIQHYLENTLGLKSRSGRKPSLQLPFFIQDAYELIRLQLTLITGSEFTVLLVVQREDEYPGIVALRKHLDQIRKVTRDTLVYVNRSLSAADRKSLITHHVNFIQPDMHLFISELALDLREAWRQQRSSPEVSHLLPAAQAILIACLTRGWSLTTGYTSSQIAQGMGYSRVTLSKVIEQFIALNVLERAEKARTYRFTAPEPSVLENMMPLMKSPVKRKASVNARLQLGNGVFWAGETALAQYSMLAEPVLPVYALTQETLSQLLKQGVIAETNSTDESRATIELWNYPNPIKDAQAADPLSLYLSLKDNRDERIQMALDEMKEGIVWLK